MDDILLDVQGVSHCFGLVGESGSGKSTMARCIMSILRPTAGAIRYLGVNICDPGQFRAHKELLQTSRQLIFQDSASSLDPRMTVADIIAEPMAIHRARPPRGSLRNEAAFQLKCVGLDQGCLDRRPGELSGGQRQRKLVEVGPAIEVFADPRHPYTQALLSAIPIPDPRQERARVPRSFDPAQFCREGRLREVSPGHWVLEKEGES